MKGQPEKRIVQQHGPAKAKPPKPRIYDEQKSNEPIRDEVRAIGVTVSKVEQEQAQYLKATKTQADENVDMQRKLAKYTLWLAIVGGATALFIGWQALETKRAADAARASVGAINQQTGVLRTTLNSINREIQVMERQTVATEKSATATAESANATRESAQATLRQADLTQSQLEFSHRAWIFVSFENRPPFRLDEGNGIAEIPYTIKNHGNSPGWMTSFAARVRLVSDESELSPEPDYESMGATEHDLAFAPDAESRNTLTCTIDDYREVALQRQGQKTMFVYGRLFYRDVFGIKVRETRFCVAYQPEIMGVGFIKGGFFRAGPQRYNKET